MNEAERLVGVPLAAAAFGRRKLEASPFKVAVEEDRRLLMQVGADSRLDAQRGIAPRIERFVQSIARLESEGHETLGTHLAMLEYIASQVPSVYGMLAELMLEANDTPDGSRRAQEYLRRQLEVTPVGQRAPIWERLADICAAAGDAMGEVHAIGELALLPNASLETVSRAANRINSKVRDLKGQRVDEAWSPEVRALFGRVATVMERQRANLSAIECSRLAWLYLNIGMTDRARDTADLGLERDPTDVHCQRLVRNLTT